MAQTINAKDTVSAKKAECFITIEGKRYNFMQAIDLEAKIEDFKTDDVSVELGNDKKTVIVSDAVKVINAMSKLYMTVSVS
ncbi:hypothetical protein KLO03_17880 [Clostridioides difficile]|nr:hypothetical protein [Clostridioides difficile]